MQIGLLINEPFLFAYSKLFVSTVVWRQAMKESQKSKKVPGSIRDTVVVREKNTLMVNCFS